LRKFLVTGGAGFIDGNFIRQALQQDSVQVLNLDKLTYAGNLYSLQDIARSPNYCFAKA